MQSRFRRSLWGATRFLVVLTAFSPTPVAYSGEHDGEWWSKLTLEKDLAELGFPTDSELVLDYEPRKDRDMENVFQESLGVGLNLPIPTMRKWSLGSFYRRFDRNGNPDENRYYFDLTREFESSRATGWDLAVRSRFELRDFVGQPHLEYRLRQRVEMLHDLPLKVDDKALRLFANGEGFLDFQDDKWNRYRLGGGLIVPLRGGATLRVGYQLEANRLARESSWDYDSMLVTELGFRF